MSAQELPCLQQLEQEVEVQLTATQKEAIRMSAKFKESDLGELDTDQQHRKPSPEKKEVQEVRLNLPEEVPPAKINIFDQRPSSQPSLNIFGNTKSVNLFSLNQQNNSQQSLNIFANAMGTAPAIDLRDPDELSENSQGSNRSHQELKEPTERIMKYDYQQTFEKLGEFRVVKFRAGVGAVKEGLLVSLEKEINKPEKVLHLVLRGEITKVVVYQAFLLPGAKAEQFMGRKENLKLNVLRLRMEKKRDDQVGEEKKEGEEGNKEENSGPGHKEKLVQEKEQVKLQFEKEEDAQAFENLLNTYFSKTE